uniref:Proteolipid protein 1b n=1 Tax=Scleropages formosus TaxID=113540 RepID=A0A8C9R574_SCLFO
MHPWWPHCYAFRVWRCSVAAATRLWPRRRRSSRLTLPATRRTTSPWLPCEYRSLSKAKGTKAKRQKRKVLHWFSLRFSRPSIEYFQYVIYGLAAFFFLYCILLLAEGFYTTSAVKQTFGEFRSTRCGRCLSTTFVVATYTLAVIWLVVFAVSAVPVYFFYNMAYACHTINILSETTASLTQHAWVCIDARQFGLLPWSTTPGRVCGSTLVAACKTKEFFLTYDLYIAAFAGAGVTLLALFLYITSTTYNFAILRFLGRKGIRC